jgi:hypothetical protein
MPLRSSGVRFLPCIFAAAILLFLCMASLSAETQEAAPSAGLELPNSSLPQIYGYAFRVYAGDDAQAVALEYNNESGSAIRDHLRLQFGLTSEDFASFANAALDYRRALMQAQDRIDATVLADRAAHPGTAVARDQNSRAGQCEIWMTLW